MEELIMPGIVLIFTLLFYTTSLQEGCWYRRYIIPAMFIALAIINQHNFVILVLFFISAILTYYGFKGYGKKRLEEKKELKENENSN